MTESDTSASISQDPINILFRPTSAVAKGDVWEIDLIQILDLLARILEKSDRGKDLKVAGMAALSSSLIYRMKVESIFALQRAAAQKKPASQRKDVDIDLIDMPYRHESTYPVSLDDLLGLLQNLIGTIANPQSRRGRNFEIDAVEPPDFQKYFLSLESVIATYEDLIMNKLTALQVDSSDGRLGMLLQEIISDLDATDSIKCFFAILFMARDQKVDLKQIGDDILVTLMHQGDDDNTMPGQSDNDQ